MKQIFSVVDKGGHEAHVGSRVSFGSDKDHVKNYTVTKIEQRDDGWILVSIERVPEEVRPKMCLSEINTGYLIVPHWVINVTDLMEVQDVSNI